MKTLKDGFQMEDSNYVGFQSYQAVTTKEILYSAIKATSGGKKKIHAAGHELWMCEH